MISSFDISIVKGELELFQRSQVKFTKRKHARIYSYTKAGFSIAKKTLRREKSLAKNENEIIEKIHEKRFDPSQPYVITGGHFHQLYVRNLGVFYNALLDSRITLSEKDWLDRQKIALQTVALDLSVFNEAKKEYTTIIPLRGHTYTCLNMYARPSDSLNAILYSLVVLTDETYIQNLFPMHNCKTLALQTKSAGLKLIKEYSSLIRLLIKNYLAEIIDEKTKLDKKDMLLSSARDGIKRESSFYDNVIAWATIVLAKRLHLYKISDSEVTAWKDKIIKTFWENKEGLFIDDLSEESVKSSTFSADSFIVTSTGFLNASKPNERKYLVRMVEYVRKNKLDMPFPLHYAKDNNSKKLYRPVKHFARSYMGKSIWSHWGMEYIKTLILLSGDNPQFVAEARKHLDSYRRNIEKYGGYPELYKPDGDIFSSRFYKSVLQNGWVVNYEQARMMINSLTTTRRIR